MLINQIFQAFWHKVCISQVFVHPFGGDEAVQGCINRHTVNTHEELCGHVAHEEVAKTWNHWLHVWVHGIKDEIPDDCGRCDNKNANHKMDNKAQHKNDCEAEGIPQYEVE